MPSSTLLLLSGGLNDQHSSRAKRSRIRKMKSERRLNVVRHMHSPSNPDLVIIAFDMNEVGSHDAGAGHPSIQRIIRVIRTVSP